jgi:hypothetical protein
VIRRIVLIVLATVFLLVGFLLVIGGGAVMAITGSDDTLQSGLHRVSTASTALVTPIANISNTTGTTETLGQPDLRLALSGSSRPTFVGIGPADAVDQYLAGAAVDRVRDLEVDPFRLVTTPVPGTAKPAAPDSQNFWVARDSGPDPTLTWNVTDGNYRLVIMNADATPAVATDASVALRVPHLFAIGLGLLVAGGVLALIGIAVLVVALLSGRSRRPATPVGAPGPWTAPPPPVQPPPPAQETERPTSAVPKHLQ